MNIAIKNLLNTRIGESLGFPNSLGTITLVDDSQNEELHFIWDVPFQTGIEALLFQKMFITSIANLFYIYTSIPSTVSDNKIVLTLEDDRGTIVKPTTEILKSDIYSFSNHFKGHLILSTYVKSEKHGEFVNDVNNNFYSLLEEIHKENLKIK